MLTCPSFIASAYAVLLGMAYPKCGANAKVTSNQSDVSP